LASSDANIERQNIAGITPKWVAEHGAEISVDGGRIAFVNSVGGDMAAALNVGLNEKDPGIFGVHYLPAWFTIPLAPVL
jgi:acetyl esterase/lipase